MLTWFLICLQDLRTSLCSHVFSSDDFNHSTQLVEQNRHSFMLQRVLHREKCSGPCRRVRGMTVGTAAPATSVFRPRSAFA